MLRPVPRAPIKQRRQPALAPGRLRSSAAARIRHGVGDRLVANAIVRREAAGRRKRSCGPSQPDARDWAIASVAARARSRADVRSRSRVCTSEPRARSQGKSASDARGPRDARVSSGAVTSTGRSRYRAHLAASRRLAKSHKRPRRGRAQGPSDSAVAGVLVSPAPVATQVPTVARVAAPQSAEAVG